MRVVFMGTPDFALFSLDALCRSEHEVTAVITQPDKAGNRGVVSFSPVKKYALAHDIPVYQFEKIRKEGIETLKNLYADIFVTVAYGQILSREILDIPPHGIVNVHASLLPKYRGSSPIQWALINGEKKTGITIMQTAEGLDCGDILLQKSIDITSEDNAGTLFEKLGALGADALIEYLDGLECGRKFTPVKQDESQSTYFPMLSKSDGKIDWSVSAEQIINKTRGLMPWPGIYTYLNGKLLKLFDIELCDLSGEKCGEVLQADKSSIVVACGDKSVKIKELQIEGKKRMPSYEFINGNRITIGEVLG